MADFPYVNRELHEAVFHPAAMADADSRLGFVVRRAVSEATSGVRLSLGLRFPRQVLR